MADLGVDVAERTCTMSDCTVPQVGQGLCRRHYMRVWRGRDVTVGRLPWPRRFWQHVDRSGGEDACWPWSLTLNEHGYGRSRVPDRASKQLVHVTAFMLVLGPVPEGCELDHLCHGEDLHCMGGPACRHRRCCNPGHLEPVTKSVNQRRGRASFERLGLCLSGLHDVTVPGALFWPPSRTHGTCAACLALARERRRKLVA